MMSLLQAEEIRKKYAVGKHMLHVLRGASLGVRRGEAVAIVGASGAGKSTLLNVLGGLDRPDGGNVAIEGRDLYGMSSGERTSVRARRIGFVFQSYHLLPEMDVLENVMLPGMARARVIPSYPAIRRSALGLLESVGLAERASHTPMELSGGEQQRVALARALMNDPDVVLADEPTGNLDSETGGQVLHHLLSLTKGGKHSLVLVTHNRELAATCDRVLQLEQGLLTPQ